MGAPSLPPAWQLYLKDHRISTFKNWPFLEGCSCTPERVRPRGLPGPRPTRPAPEPPPRPLATSRGAPAPLWALGTWGDPSRGGSSPAVDFEMHPYPGLSRALPCRWPRLASSTAPPRTSPIWPSASSVSRSWKAGSQTTTPCKYPRPALLGFRGASWAWENFVDFKDI